MKLKNEQEVENLSDSMQRKLDITRKVWTFKDGYKSGYHQAQQDLISQASEGFEEWKNANFERLQQLFRLEFGEEAWQASRLSMLKLDQACNEVLTLNQIDGLADLIKKYDSLKKENEEMREALREANELIDAVSEDVFYMDQEPSSLAEWANRYRAKFPLSETPSSSKEGV